MKEIQKLKCKKSIVIDDIQIFEYGDKRVVEYKDGARIADSKITTKSPTYSVYEEVFQLPDTNENYSKRKLGITITNYYGFTERYIEGCCILYSGMLFNFVNYSTVSENPKPSFIGYDIFCDDKVAKASMNSSEAETILQKVKSEDYNIKDILNDFLSELIFEQG